MVDLCQQRQATTVADNTERNVTTRLNDSLYVSERVAGRLKCSAVRIWTQRPAESRTAGSLTQEFWGVE
jgi:hypothetical protein